MHHRTTRSPAGEAGRAGRGCARAPQPGPVRDPVLRDGPLLVQRTCSCGGGCPRCRGLHGAKAEPPVEPQLLLSRPDDPHEREAEVAARRVMGVWPTSTTGPRLDRTPTPLQPSSGPGFRTEIPERTGTGPTFAVLARRTGGGVPLPDGVRAFFEPRFGAALSAVRVHADAQAGEMAESIHARAFTWGRNVYFARGEYAPDSARGRRLLAHELTHTLQQGDHPTTVVQRQEHGEGRGGELATMGGRYSRSELVRHHRVIHDPAIPSRIRQMFAELMNRTRYLESLRRGEALRGTDVIAVVRVEDADGRIMAEFTGHYDNPAHAEAEAIRSVRASLRTRGIGVEQTRNGRVTVLVTKEPCGDCTGEIAQLADELGVVREQVDVVFVTRESATRPGVAVSGRTALRTRLRSPVSVGALNIFTIALGFASSAASQAASERRAARQLEEEGYAPAGASAYAEEPWYLQLARLLTGELIFAQATGGFELSASRLDVSRWRQAVRDRTRPIPTGGTFTIFYQGLDCEMLCDVGGFRVLREESVTYRKISEAEWRSSPGTMENGEPVPDLVRILDVYVPDSEVMSMLFRAGRCPCSISQTTA